MGVGWVTWGVEIIKIALGSGDIGVFPIIAAGGGETIDALGEIMDDMRIVAVKAGPRYATMPYLQIHSSGHFRDFPEHATQRDDPLDYLVIWVLGGRGYVRTGKSAKSTPARAGDLLVMPKGLPHAYGADPAEPWDIVWAHFDGDAAADLVKRLQAFGELRIRLGLDAHIHERFLELVVAHDRQVPRSQHLCDCLLWGLLGLIIHRLEIRGEVREPDRLPDMQRLQKYIHENLRRKITLHDLADVAGLSVSQLGRVFASLFKVSPMQYVIQQRMARACLLLTETTMPVKQVAAAVGCDDPYYFSRLFRRVVGAPPRAYRRNVDPSP